MKQVKFVVRYNEVTVLLHDTYATTVYNSTKYIDIQKTVLLFFK